LADESQQICRESHNPDCSPPEQFGRYGNLSGFRVPNDGRSEHTGPPNDRTEDIAEEKHGCDEVPNDGRFVEVACDLQRIGDWGRRGIRSDHQLSVGNRGVHTNGTYTLIVIIPVTVITSHFFDADQFCGLFGSFGPSHEIGFRSTGSLTGASVSEEPGS